MAMSPVVASYLASTLSSRQSVASITSDADPSTTEMFAMPRSTMTTMSTNQQQRSKSLSFLLSPWQADAGGRRRGG